MHFHALVWIVLVVFCMSKAANTDEADSNLIPCKQGWFLFDQKCYRILGEDKGLNWKQASVNCSLERGQLVTINSAELQEFLAAYLLLNARSNAWIGLNDEEKESQFSWEDGTVVNYTNWDEKEPSRTGGNREKEDCVEMRFRDPKARIGTWNDLDCSRELPYFCQTDKSENTFSPDPRFCTVEEGQGWKYLNTCYQVVTEEKSWEDAENYCVEKYSGHLVTIADEKAEMFLKYLLPNQSDFWIGIKMQDIPIQVWSSGWHVMYRKWDHEQTHFLAGTCGRISKKSLWTVGPCFRELPFICEKPTSNAPVPKKSPEGWRCPDLSKEWLDFNGEYCYLFETNKTLNWYEASYECGRKGGILASIHSEAETYILHPHVKNTTEKAFIGFHRNLAKKDIFEWADGSKLDYLNWSSGEPNSIREECGEVWTASMKWNDVPCTSYTAKGYICSAKKVPPDMIEINKSTSSDCVCPMPSNISEISASASEDHVSSSGLSAKTVAGIVVCILLVAVLTGIVVYYSRNFCKRQRNGVVRDDLGSFTPTIAQQYFV